MNPTTFEPFTAQHGYAVLAGMVVGAAILMAGLRGGKSRRLAAAVLAFANLAAWPLSQFAWMGYTKTWDNILPFHLCDVAAITAGFALITGNRLLRKLTYFWGLAATLQALLTPAVVIGFPHGPFIMFFVHHFAVVIAAVWFPVVDGWRPRTPLWRDPLHVYGWSVLYLAFAMVVNRVLGTNFAFAASPPPNPSLIDHLGPWPWYLLGMQALAVLFFLLLAMPFRWVGQKTGKQRITHDG
jgi:hypothetical integral membrane protein (TIGR02206 family)